MEVRSYHLLLFLFPWSNEAEVEIKISVRQATMYIHFTSFD